MIKRVLAWPPREVEKKRTARDQDRALAAGLDEGCLFCDAGPWAWAYPMKRAQQAADGGDILFPAWLPVCEDCHDDVESERYTELEARLVAANPGRRNRRMRELLPVFLEGRDGPPIRRGDAPHLVRATRKRRRG